MTKKSEDNIAHYPNSLETRIALVESAIININQTLARIENKMDTGFHDLKDEIRDVRKDMRYDFRFLVTVICGLSAIMAHGFHWF